MPMIDRTTPYIVSVLEHSCIARDTYEITVEKPEGYTFRAGQYVGLRMPLVGEFETDADHRFFSPLTAPHESSLRFVTRIRTSAFKEMFKKLNVGDTVEIGVPMGSFVIEDTQGPLVFLAGGVGISPVRSMIFDMVDRGLMMPCYIFHVNRTVEDVVYADEFLALAKKELSVHYESICTQEEADAGHFKVKDLTNVLPEVITKYDYFVVGSHPFCNDAMNRLKESDVLVEQIRYDRFCGYYG